MLIHLSADSGINSVDMTRIFDELGANYQKIAITQSDGTTQLYVEVEKWDNTNGEAWLWVSKTGWQISSTADTVLYLYYDAGQADNTTYVGLPNSTPGAAVWDSNFVLVDHMRDDPDSSYTRDSTGNSNDGTKINTDEPVETDGLIAKAQNFDGSNDKINCGTDASLDITGAITIEAVAKAEVLSGDHFLVDKLGGGFNYNYGLYYRSASNDLRVIWDDGTGYEESYGGSALSTGTWYHLAGVMNGSRKITYINGVENTNQAATKTSIVENQSGVLYLGSRDTVYFWNGLIDEVRISNTARSAAWLKASYETANDNLLTFGMVPVTYTYDSTTGGNYGKGKRTGMTDALGATGYKYDIRGRLTEEKRTVDSTDYTTQFTYDGIDRVATITYPTGETVTNTYNGRGLPYTVSGSVAGNLVTSTLYNNLGQVTEMNFNNGLRTTFGYWDVGGGYDTTGGYYGRLWELKTLPQAGGTALQDVKHTWDAGGNLYQREDVLASETETFTYDFLDRLAGVSGPYSKSYAYNQIGNITSMNGNSYTYGTKPHAVTAVGGTNYVYDANGNMTTRGNQSITWDMENRPVSVSGGASFVYDGDGKRGKKTEGGETVLYVNKYYEKNLTTGQVTTYYYLGDRLVFRKTPGNTTFFHQDHLTSTALLTDTQGGQVGTTQKYYPYGSARSGSLPNTAQMFTGQRLDDIGLYYYGARYYDAGIGRFISADTIVPDPMNPQSLNRYSYVLNNPLRYTDPTGHHDFEEYETQEYLDYVYTVISISQHSMVTYQAELAQFSHTILDAVGLVPLFGEPADAANALLYVMEGDWGNATLSTAAVIPVIGWAATGGKYVSKVSDLSNLRKGWKVGDPINTLTSKGTTPSWNAVRERYWKNEAYYNASKYDTATVARMEKGLAYQEFNRRTGRLESFQLHHDPTQSQGNLFNFKVLSPDQHKAAHFYQTIVGR